MTHDAPTAIAGAAPGWRLPAEALAGFRAPPRGLVVVGSTRSQEFARYGFRVGDIGFLIAKRTDSELIEPRGIAPIPGSAAWLRGMMNRRGHPVPVFDLRVALDLPDRSAAEQARVLVLGKGADALGLVVDSLPVALRGLVATRAPAALPSRLTPFIDAAWIADEQLWLDGDVPGLLMALQG